MKAMVTDEKNVKFAATYAVVSLSTSATFTLVYCLHLLRYLNLTSKLTFRINLFSKLLVAPVTYLNYVVVMSGK